MINGILSVLATFLIEKSRKVMYITVRGVIVMKNKKSEKVKKNTVERNALCIPESSRLYLEDGFPVLCEQEITFELAHVNNVAFVAKSKQLYEIFQKQIPENTQRHDILFKVAALCGLYEDLHVNAEQITDHILAIKNFDIRLAKGVMSLVDDIAKYSDKSYFAVYFARMYCGYHRPDQYPMGDRYIEYAMMNYAWLMKMPQPYYSELKRYGVFKRFFQALMIHCNLEHIPQEDILHFFYFVGKRKLDKEWRQNISKTKESFFGNEHILNIINRIE